MTVAQQDALSCSLDMTPVELTSSGKKLTPDAYVSNRGTVGESLVKVSAQVTSLGQLFELQELSVLKTLVRCVMGL